MFENVNIDWNLSHDDGSTDFSDEETLEDQPRTLTRTPDRANRAARPMSVYTTPILNGGGGALLHSPPSGGSAPLAGAESSSALEDSPDSTHGGGNRSNNSSDWSRSNNTSDSGDSPGSYRNSIMPPPPPPQSKKPSLCKCSIKYIYCTVDCYMLRFVVEGKNPPLDVSVKTRR
jgi:Arf-GAP with SH3 domain, ANK repeat and PH domain-containing protein